MEIDTVIALVALIGLLNAPFYYMCLNTWKSIERIKANCPHCTVAIPSIKQDYEEMEEKT